MDLEKTTKHTMDLMEHKVDKAAGIVGTQRKRDKKIKKRKPPQASVEGERNVRQHVWKE